MPSESEVQLCLSLDIPIVVSGIGIHSPYCDEFAKLGNDRYSFLFFFATFNKAMLFKVFESISDDIKQYTEPLYEEDDFDALICFGDMAIPEIETSLEIFTRQKCSFDEDKKSFIFKDGSELNKDNYKEVAKYVTIASNHHYDEFEDEEEYIKREMRECTFVGKSREQFEEFLRRQQKDLKREKEERAKVSSNDSLNFSTLVSVLSCAMQKSPSEFKKWTIWQIRDQYNLQVMRENKHDFQMQLSTGLYDMEKALPQLTEIEWKNNRKL